MLRCGDIVCGAQGIPDAPREILRSRVSVFLAKPVSDAALRVKKLASLSELVPQPVQMRVYRPAVDRSIITPDVAQEHFATLYAAPAKRQGGEELKLRICEDDIVTSPGNGMADEVDHQMAEYELIQGHFAGLVALDELLDAQDQFAGTEGLDQVVVRASLKTLHAVGFGSFGGEDENGNPLRRGVRLEQFAEFEPTELGHHDVENQEVGRRLPDFPQCSKAAGSRLHLELSFAEAELNEIEQFGFVIHHQDLRFHLPLGVARGGRRLNCTQVGVV